MKFYFIQAHRIHHSSPNMILLGVIEVLKDRGYDVNHDYADDILVNISELDSLEKFDLFILTSHTEVSLSLWEILYEQGMLLLNPYPAVINAHDKILTTKKLQSANIPVPRTWGTGNTSRIYELIETENINLVIKPYHGQYGANVWFVDSLVKLENVSLPREIPILAQEWIPNKNGEYTVDSEVLKTYCIGNKLFTLRKQYSKGHCISQGRLCSVDDEIFEIAINCGQTLGLKIYGIDIIESPNGPFVIDVNSFPSFKGIPKVDFILADFIESYVQLSKMNKENLELTSDLTAYLH